MLHVVVPVVRHFFDLRVLDEQTHAAPVTHPVELLLGFSLLACLPVSDPSAVPGTLEDMPDVVVVIVI